jgi:SAM-dependent methyltransferase
MNHDYLDINRADWNAYAAEYQSRALEALERAPDAWGVWRIPESELNILGDVRGKSVLEFGCGAAQWSIALAKRGAHPVGIDLSQAQLRYASTLQSKHRLSFPLIECSATSVPLPNASFDVVFCDHGAMTFADPYHTVPEAARLLKPGGLLAFCLSSPLREICYDKSSEKVGRTLRSSYFELHRSEEDGSVTFCLGYGAWIALFRSHGFAVERLEELRPPQSTETVYGSYVPYDWARDYPGEIIWVARKL